MSVPMLCFSTVAVPTYHAECKVNPPHAGTEASIVGIFPAVEQRCLQNISVYKTPDGSFLFVQVGIAAVQQLHAGRNIAVPADENRAAADKRTGVR